MRQHAGILCSALLLGVISVGSTGCVGLASGTLPPKLSATEKARLKDAHLHLTVGVESQDNTAVSRLVISQLRATKLFDAVDYVDRLPGPPNVLARFEHTPYGTATVPCLTLVTFGLIPTIVGKVNNSGDYGQLSIPRGDGRLEFRLSGQQLIPPSGLGARFEQWPTRIVHVVGFE